MGPFTLISRSVGAFIPAGVSGGKASIQQAVTRQIPLHRTQELLHHKWVTARSLYKRGWLFVHGKPIGSATSAVPIPQLQVILKEAYRRLNLKPACFPRYEVLVELAKGRTTMAAANVRRDWRPGSAAHAKGM
jgi:hypothetical protein